MLIGCEFSGLVREAFKNRGHEAWSCDLRSTEIPGRHIQRDIIHVIEGDIYDFWDLLICFPPCTHLAVSGARWFKNKKKEQENAIRFFMELANAPIRKIAIENPVGIMSTRWREPDQIIQPYQFGDPYRKKTCLWLKNLPLLKSTKIVEPKLKRYKDGSVFSVDYGWSTNKRRSVTYPGIAKAMAEQWG